mmetsp:Transcript_93397/g.166138  ORF Transcript_93397/g.166138 Transcript_93397/m.166138 type:complete len:229 (-) Transcript_93397:62-748(-)|eukprot:CAMPEP_0197668306 /NCGR_PEP_ID=MMETSP1338-20131121/68947_1 /TAXON_ID=43686 ORGANISM="Pelagodinium beii, Strain RCC1491" /NCGR_SAMPLE_ID=MMETSP1338 /ASSEMBLY_ACC=CAM_ASM_000754 /LENGTH=228 /DNA_ID=CAMNT_0043247703 /DNA_START=8 /DNA_END=694 /DNA_ORIENTATION=+
MWMAGDVGSLSDMHAKWAEKGGHEFVPVSLNYGGAAGGVAQSSRGRQQMAHGAVSFRGMNQNGQMAGGWGNAPPGMQMQGGWRNMPGTMAPEGQWAVSAGQSQGQNFVGMGPPGSSVSGAQQTFLVAVWNLSNDYTSQAVKADLLDIDFHVDRCHDVDRGAFLLEFSEVWHANALVVSLDGTQEHLRTTGPAPIRLSSYSMETGKWSSEDVPLAIQQAQQQVNQMMQS